MYPPDRKMIRYSRYEKRLQNEHRRKQGKKEREKGILCTQFVGRGSIARSAEVCVSRSMQLVVVTGRHGGERL
jgi:hypothetical protein